jgi:hypothetical protein
VSSSAAPVVAKPGSMRFNDPEYVAAWRRDGTFPAIHTKLVELVLSKAKGRTFVDLCGSTGLLGRQLVSRGMTGSAVEASSKAIIGGAYDGAYLALELRLTPASLPILISWIRTTGAVTAIARRCLPELADAGLWPDALGQALIEAGITELFLEGRVVSARSVHKLASAELEIAALAKRWKLVTQVGACAYLRPRSLGALGRLARRSVGSGRHRPEEARVTGGPLTEDGILLGAGQHLLDHGPAAGRRPDLANLQGLHVPLERPGVPEPAVDHHVASEAQCEPVDGVAVGRTAVVLRVGLDQPARLAAGVADGGSDPAPGGILAVEPALRGGALARGEPVVAVHTPLFYTPAATLYNHG